MRQRGVNDYDKDYRRFFMDYHFRFNLFDSDKAATRSGYYGSYHSLLVEII